MPRLVAISVPSGYVLTKYVPYCPHHGPAPSWFSFAPSKCFFLWKCEASTGRGHCPGMSRCLRACTVL